MATVEASRLLRMIRRRAGLSLRRLAELAGTSHSTLAAYEAGRVEPSVATLARIAHAAGFEITLELKPLPYADPADRGDELLQVLELAAMFPARHARHLDAPIFGRP